jgi:HAE1 family hydrophobic/amphiphilic exporter-1
VASASISGGQEREILVEVDRPRMEAQGISLASIVDSLKDANLNYPAGTVQGKFYEYLVRTMGEFKNIAEIGRTVIKVERPQDEEERDRYGNNRDRENHPREARLSYLNDLASVQDTFKERTSFSRYNGHENISITIQKQADANALTTAQRVRVATEELQTILKPKGVNVELVYDESRFIEDAISGVATDGIVGGILAFFVLYFFLKSWTVAAIVALAIPASTLITFTGMFFKKISINMLSLAGLGLGIGNMVDNSIVVAENIARHQTELGKGRIEAAVDGTDEVAPSMVTSSLTNVAVLLPLLFAKGVAQLVFRDMFFIVTCASFASVFISITLVPLLSAHPVSFAFIKTMLGIRAAEPVPGGEIAPPEAPPAKPFLDRFPLPVQKALRWFLGGFSDEAYNRLMARYKSLLEWVLKNPSKTVVGITGGALLSLGLLGFQDRVFMPKVDQGQFILKIQMPVGTRLEITNEVTEKVEAVLKSLPGFREVTVSVGSNNVEAVDALGDHQSQAIVNLDRSKVATEDYIETLKDTLDKQDLQGAEVQYVLQDSLLASAFETAAPIVIECKGPDMTTLRKIADDILRDVTAVPGVFGAKTSLALPSSETRVEIDKLRAASYHLNTAEIARTALIGIKGFVATTYKEAGQEVDVRVRLRPEDRADVDSIGRLTVLAPGNVMVPLSEIASLVSARGPSEIKHLDQQRSIVVSANVAKRSTNDVIKDVTALLEKYHNLSDYQVVLSGESQRIKESFGGLAVAMIFATLLVYMIMAAEFESFGNPFIIMITVPFSVVGVALSLFFTRTPISAPVILGMILLVGSVVNYGIILIDFMNQKRREGSTLWDAVVEGCTTRLRPVLMSSLTTILAVFPLALGLSEGSELASPMAVVTFGGLGISVLLSLFILPLAYYHSELWREKRGSEPAAS